ncbi:hypothetical protein BKA82DRAFT_4211149, partial [Pisolithus tinctorius]
KFLASLPCARAAHSRRSRKSHGDPVTTETSAAEASNPAGDMTGFVPVVVTRNDAAEVAASGRYYLGTEASNLTGEMTGLGTTINNETTPSPATFHMDPEKAKKYLENIEKFRVLVIGRGMLGKTTILQRVCNSVDKPDVFDGEGNKIDNDVVQGTSGRGYHNIEDELVFKSNQGFVFHDSRGFEAGSAEQFEEMKKTLKKRIHAIWYCIPMTDYHRTVTAAEQKFFNECDTGHVPVIVLLTKVDALNFAAIEELLDEERESLLLEKWQTHCKFPPKMYLPLTNSQQRLHNESAGCTTLIQPAELLISTQQSSIGLCIEYAVNW